MATKRVVLLRKDGVKQHYKVNTERLKATHKYDKHLRAWKPITKKH